MPESGERHRVRFDPVGLLLGVGGFVVLTYGVIEAGERGWSDGLVWAAMIAAVALIAGFIGWQLRLQAQKAKDEQLLIDLSIFAERGFSWGIVLAVLASFSMFGLLFAAPQYFQAVTGTGALGTGVRLLPMVGGLIVGGRIGGAAGTRLGAKAIVGIGFVVMAAGLFLGATTSTGTNFAFTGTWMAIYGLGLGLCLPTAMTAAISAMPADRSGMGSGLLMSSRMVGGSIGVAVLGSIVNSGYRSHIALSGLPAQAAESVRAGASTGVRVAAALGSPSLLDSVRSAFLHGMDVMLVSCGVLTVVAAILGVLFLPNGLTEPAAQVGPALVDGGESEHDVVVPDPAGR
jgi:DHA2 family multidrug resistance protein-like MFS transporter